jgi:hypothetical protein
MEKSRVRDVGLTWRSWIYVAAVASIASAGTRGSATTHGGADPNVIARA